MAGLSRVGRQEARFWLHGVLASGGVGGEGRGLVGFAADQDGPSDAGQLVGYGDGSLLCRHALQQGGDPGREAGIGLDPADEAGAGIDQELAEISVTALGDRAEGGLAAGGILRGDQAKPSGTLPAAVEAGRIADGGDEGARGEGGKLGDGVETLAVAVALVPGGDLPFERNDL